MNILEEFFNNHTDLAHEMLQNSGQMWLISTEYGEILWANEAFCEFIGYTMYEFRRDKDGIKWHDITLHDESLEADIAQAQAAINGDIKSYKVRKWYIPKNSAPIFVELYVRRYPPNRENKAEFLVVEVIKLSDESAKLLASYDELSKKTEMNMGKLTERMTDLVESVQKMNALTFNGFVAFLYRYPKVSVISIAVLLSLILGPRIFELVNEAITIFVKWHDKRENNSTLVFTIYIYRLIFFIS